MNEAVWISDTAVGRHLSVQGESGSRLIDPDRVEVVGRTKIRDGNVDGSELRADGCALGRTKITGGRGSES